MLKYVIVLITPTEKKLYWNGATWIVDITKVRIYYNLPSATVDQTRLYKDKARFLPRCQVWVDIL